MTRIEYFGNPSKQRTAQVTREPDGLIFVVFESGAERMESHAEGSEVRTVWIRKATPYTYASTLRDECERLVAWAKRNYADAVVLECPTETRHCNQAALVVITDPVMQKLEKFMPEMQAQKG